jgi:hypothetical protein
MIYDFFSPSASAMERYRRFEAAWTKSPKPGGLPPHSCTALRELVEEQKVVDALLRYGQGQNPNGSEAGGGDYPGL